jgi:hypothetical protein
LGADYRLRWNCIRPLRLPDLPLVILWLIHPSIPDHAYLLLLGS